jgi:hypothetical protein
MDRWNAHALVVGIAGYGDARRNLPEAVRNDARDVHALLVAPDRCGYPPEHAGEPLLDDHAHKDGILAALKQLAERADPDSTVFFYYSGHGGRIDNHEYLLPHDLDTSSPEAARQSAISMNEFSDQLRAIRAGQLLVVLDCCHSAGTVALKGAPAMAGSGSAIVKSGFGEAFAKSALRTGRGRAVLASCLPEEDAVILPRNARNSLFTTHLLDGLRGQAAGEDGQIRVFRLWEYVRAQVQAAYPGQHPVFKADLQDHFVIARNGAAAKGVPLPKAADGFRYDAFIAFADADFDWVYDQLVPRLERRGLTFTVSADNITAAKAVAAQEAIQQSRYVLLVLSPNYSQDAWVQHTAVLGIHHSIETASRKVIPVKIAQPRQEVLMSVNALVGVDLTQPGRRFDMGIERLLKTLAPRA